MVAMPVVINAITSLEVIRSRYGFTTRAASVWPMKIFAAAARLSLPLVRMNFCMTSAIP